MADKKLMRRLTVFFLNGEAVPFVLEPLDSVAFKPESITIAQTIGGYDIEVEIERTAVAYTKLIPYELEVLPDRPKLPKAEPKPDLELL